MRARTLPQIKPKSSEITVPLLIKTLLKATTQQMLLKQHQITKLPTTPPQKIQRSIKRNRM